MRASTGSVLCVLLALAAHARAQCAMEPPSGVTNSLRSPGDGGFGLLISGDPERYVPGSVYTLSLTAPPGKTFRRFLVTVEPADAAARRWAGSFQLFGDAAAQFAPACINAVSEGDTPSPAPQVEVQTMWRAPTQGSGCVRFKAMVQEDDALWFADEGALSRTLCELVMTHAHEDVNVDEPRECCACDDAKYKFVFQGIWSNTTHPKDFPFSLWLTHFSDVIGASHEANFSFWGEGQIASDGFRQLAEWGSVGWLERELRAKSRHLRTLVKAPGLWYPRVTQNTSATFNVDRRHHLVSLASMFGPSPDWVVGVSGLDLCLADCSWVEDKVIDLYPIDAGTDSGITYMSPNAPTVPREEMYRITTMYPEDPRAPFYDPHGADMQPLARLHISRTAVTRKPCKEDDDASQELDKESVFEDIETVDDGERPECRVDEWTPWSPCSVSCGKGLRMRQRNYQMDAKAQMFGCDRQLVQKEMCVAHDASCPGDPVELDPNEVGTPSEVENINCAVTPWGPWSECSSSCGPGFEVRSRRFEDRAGIKKCPFVELTERRKCSLPACVDTVPVDPSCRLTEWSDWSPCSVSCGAGRKFRSRLVLVADEVARERCARYHKLSEERPCSIKESCITSTADAEEACLQPEESGPCRAYFERWYFDRAARQCRPFGYGGCRGNRNNFHSLTECNTICASVREKLARGVPLAARLSAPAPAAPAVSTQAAQAEAVSALGPRVDCVVSEWGEWSPCTATCGLGYRERHRRVLVEPIRGGRVCPNRLRGRKKCYGGPCDPFQAALSAEDNL